MRVPHSATRTLLRGPKTKHVLPYFASLLALSTLLCFPHFFEFLIDEEGDDVYEDFYKGGFLFKKHSFGSIYS